MSWKVFEIQNVCLCVYTKLLSLEEGIPAPDEHALSIMSKLNSNNFDTPNNPAPFFFADFELFLDALDLTSELSAEFGLLLECFMLFCEFNRDVASDPNTRPLCKGIDWFSFCDAKDDSSKGTVVWVSFCDKRSPPWLTRDEADEFLGMVLEENLLSSSEGEAFLPNAPISLTASFCLGESNRSFLRKHSSNDLDR